MNEDQTEKLALIEKIQGIAGEEMTDARARLADWTRDLEFRQRTAAVIQQDAIAKSKTYSELESIAEDVRAGKL